jgi:hypothetical protein
MGRNPKFSKEFFIIILSRLIDNLVIMLYHMLKTMTEKVSKV